MSVETQVSPTPDTASAATPATEPAAPVTGTAEPSVGNGATGEAQTTEEQNLGGVDIKSLPKEIQSLLKEKHDAMLRDYKDKTTKLAEERKKYEPLSKKAEALDKLLQDERFANLYRSIFEPQPEQPTEELTKEQVLEKEIQSIKSELINKDAQATVTEFASEVDAKGQKLRPDFDELTEEGLISGYLQVNPPASRAEFKAKLEEAYKWANTLSTKFKELGRKQALEEMQKKASEGVIPPQSGVKGSYDGPDPKTLTPEQAVAYAKLGKRVPKY